MIFIQADATRLPFVDDSFDLVLGSPPYADARTYGIGAQRNPYQWVDFMLKVTEEACRVSKGLVIWIAAGVTRKWNYWPACEGLMWEWFKKGGQQWRPCFWHRVGIPGSGGKQWLRADVEYALCFTKCEGAVPFADNVANGHPPKWNPGGDMSHRTVDGKRVGGKDAMGFHKYGGRGKDKNGVKKKVRRCTRGKIGGDTIQEDVYIPPKFANPGVLAEPEETAEEVLDRWLAESGDETPNCIKGIRVGGGLMGHRLAHANEAPFPEKLAEWFLRGWCPRGGRVLDPFSGSGTTVAVATKLGMKGIGCDQRLSQCELGRNRCKDIQVDLF